MSDSISPSILCANHGAPIQPEHVLVVVPTLNEKTHIEACLASLLDNDPFARAARIVVADGGSNDGTRDIVKDLSTRYPELLLVDNPGRLQSAGLNNAVAEAATDAHRFLVRCDAHAVYPRGYVRAVVEALAAKPQAASVTSVLDSRGATCFARAAAFIVETPLGSGGSWHRGGTRSDWVDHGHHAGFRLDWFRHVGGYDPTFSHNEDAEFDVRLAAAGGRVWLAADLRLDYQMRPRVSGLLRQYWNYGRGRAKTVLKHWIRPRLRQVLPVVVLVGLALSVLASILSPWSLAIPALYLLALAGVSIWAALVMGTPCGLFAGAALAIMHNAWAAGFLREVGARVLTARKAPGAPP